ncbi:MAG: SDR family oxidoreductase [Planctomycetes bacterium]|nr:SDR family oxidoreductase [Planctomycetota bacterium]
MNHTEKVVIITGAAGVLCSALSRYLLKEGYKVVLLGRTLKKLQDLKEKLDQEGLEQTLAIGCDVMQKEDLNKAYAQIMEKWGRIDILVNGAGGNHPKGTSSLEQMTSHEETEGSFFTLEMDAFKSVNELNFIGTLLPTQVFGQAMLENGGSVVNISSMAAFQPLTKVAAYSAAKAAIDNFTRWLSVHLAPRGIRVNALAPGFFLTEQNRFLLMSEDGKGLTPRGQKIINNTPMHRFGEAKELGSALRFLIHEDSSFVTGIVLPVDGGFAAFSGV